MRKFGILAGHPALYLIDDRMWTTCAAASNIFTLEECAKIIAYWDEDKSIDAQIRRNTIEEGVSYVVDDSMRSGRIQWLDPNLEKFSWITQRLAQAITQVNEDAFGFHLEGMFDKLQLTRYLPGDKYKWHEDTGTGMHRRRKLSFTLQLSDPKDFEGGGLAFPTGPVKTPGNDLGALAVFPSFLMHRAAEVTKGTRWALVGWFSGPEWR